MRESNRLLITYLSDSIHRKDRTTNYAMGQMAQLYNYSTDINLTCLKPAPSPVQLFNAAAPMLPSIVAATKGHPGGRALQSRSLPPTQQGCTALHKTSAGKRHAKKVNPLQRSRHPKRVTSTPALAQAPPTIRPIARPPTPQLFSRFNSRATHARAI
jgi:hypothetical protein